MNVIQATKLDHRIMRYELGDHEWGVIKPMLPWANIPRNEIAWSRSASAPISTERETWSSGLILSALQPPGTDCAEVPAAASPRPGKLTVKQLPRSAS